METIQAFLWMLAIACFAQPAFSHSSFDHGRIEQAAAESHAQQLADCLALLKHMSPAAEPGARIYLAAVRPRCGRALDTAGLRQVMAQDSGVAILMGLIRAAANHDAAARQRLVAQVQCAFTAAP